MYYGYRLPVVVDKQFGVSHPIIPGAQHDSLSASFCLLTETTGGCATQLPYPCFVSKVLLVWRGRFSGGLGKVANYRYMPQAAGGGHSLHLMEILTLQVFFCGAPYTLCILVGVASDFKGPKLVTGMAVARAAVILLLLFPSTGRPQASPPPPNSSSAPGGVLAPSENFPIRPIIGFFFLYNSIRARLVTAAAKHSRSSYMRPIRSDIGS